MGEGQADVNETHGIGEGLNMLSSPYKPNFGKRRTANYYCGTTKQNNQRKEISCILFADHFKEITVTYYLDQTFTHSHSLRTISLLLDHRPEPRGIHKGRTIRKVMGGEGNFRAARIFFRYQILCTNFI